MSSRDIRDESPSGSHPMKFLFVSESSFQSRARSEIVVENLRSRLAETEARLERARAREAELNRRLDEMKQFLSVMEVVEAYLMKRLNEQQARILSRISSSSTTTVTKNL